MAHVSAGGEERTKGNVEGRRTPQDKHLAINSLGVYGAVEDISDSFNGDVDIIPEGGKRVRKGEIK